MKSKLIDGKVEYNLPLVSQLEGENQTLFSISDFIGKKINIQFSGNINCTQCSKKIKKTYLNGLCFKCFQEAPQASPCVLRPELCKAHLGEGRDPKWEEENHNQPHVVYLAAGDVVKVGVTRATQIPTRWIDQGAVSVIKLAETPNRYLAGVIEVALKSEFTDKTNWRNMLKNIQDESLDLEEEKWRVEELLPSDLAEYVSDDDEILMIDYPVMHYPKKVTSISLDKQQHVEEVLIGVKGQYLIFEGDKVMNVRSHSGYEIEIN